MPMKQNLSYWVTLTRTAITSRVSKASMKLLNLTLKSLVLRCDVQSLFIDVFSNDLPDAWDTPEEAIRMAQAGGYEGSSDCDSIDFDYYEVG